MNGSAVSFKMVAGGWKTMLRRIESSLQKMRSGANTQETRNGARSPAQCGINRRPAGLNKSRVKTDPDCKSKLCLDEALAWRKCNDAAHAAPSFPIEITLDGSSILIS